MKKIVLITGAAGFIGSNYIHYMFRKYDNEIRIINVDKLTYAGNLENLKDIEDRDNYTFVKADIVTQMQSIRFLRKMILIEWYILQQRVMWIEVSRIQMFL